MKKYGYVEGNRVSQFFATLKLILLVKRKDVQGDTATFVLLQQSAEFLLWIGELFNYVICIAAVALFIKPDMAARLNPVQARIIAVGVFCLILVLARTIRISRLEIRHMDDEDFLSAIIGGLMTVIATVIALIEFFKGMILS